MSAIGTALVWTGGAAAAGGAVGAVTSKDPLGGALYGAGSFVALTTIGGLIVALVSKDNRDAGLATAGIGLLGAFALGVAGAARSYT